VNSRTYPFHLERTVVIQAKPQTVFEFLTDSSKWATWWGSGSTIDAKPGGKVYIRHPNGIESAGEVVEVFPPERLSFTYGFLSGEPVPAGGSLVTIRLVPHDGGTRLELLHEFTEAGPRDEHVQGWRFQLSLFANAVANEVHANAAVTVDEWFEAWAIADENARQAALTKIASPQIQFFDRFSLLDGLPELSAHIGAAQRFMPNIRLRRRGEIQHCQGTVLGHWIAVGADGKELMAGTNVFTISPDGLITSVTGFTNPSPVQ
jgi:uncharacterized protein YndB with AHSA1/START domain